jgi:hypothetical protein
MKSTTRPPGGPVRPPGTTSRPGTRKIAKVRTISAPPRKAMNMQAPITSGKRGADYCGTKMR